MDWLAELGSIAVGSRLKRLSDIFVAEVATVYREQEIDLNPRFFPLVSLLAEHESMGVTEIADALRVTHAAVSQMTRQLEKDGWVSSESATADDRKRLVSLTAAGRAKVSELQPLWRQIRSAVNGLLIEADGDFLNSIAALEKALAKKPFSQRALEEQNSLHGLSIIPWSIQYKQAFYDLNAAWINHYFKMEQADEQSIGNPEEYYLARGGEIFFAKLAGTIVGTCAIVETAPGSFELSKMAVSQLVQGRGVGRALLEHVIAHATQKGAKVIWLETASVLKPAIALYKKLGFAIAPHPKGGSHYKRADVYMELSLSDRIRQSMKDRKTSTLGNNLRV